MTSRLVLPGGAPQFLTAPSYVLGRGADCDVLLPESDDLVSRHHARLECDAAGQWWLSDTSSNGTFVNGEPSGTRRAIHHGDQIGVGRSQIAFDAPHLAAPTPVVAPVPVGVAASPAPVVFRPIVATPAAPTEEVSIETVPRFASSPAAPTEEVSIAEVPALPFAPPPVIASSNQIAPESPLEKPRAETVATPPTLPAPQREMPAPPVQAPVAPAFVEPAPPTELDLPVAQPARPVQPAPLTDLETQIVRPIEPAPPTNLETQIVRPIEPPPTDLETQIVRPIEPPPTDLETPIVQPALPAIESPPTDLEVPDFTKPPAQTPAPSPLDAPATQKQCTRCRALYAFAEDACPQCGAAGFKVKAAATVMVPAPQQQIAPASQIAPATPEQPAPVNSPYSPAPQSQPQRPTVTPFDSQIKVSPVPLTALAGAALVGLLLVAALPWIQISVPLIGSESLNYFQCWNLLQKSGFGRNGEGGELGMMLLMPPIAFALIGGALLTSLERKKEKAQASAGLMLIGGAAGVIAVAGLFLYLKSKTSSAWGISFDPSTLLGAGFWGFGLLSAAAAGVGLWVLAASQNRK